MVDFIDEHRSEYGVEPICETLPIAPSIYYEQVRRRSDPARRSYRAKRDDELRAEIKRVHHGVRHRRSRRCTHDPRPAASCAIPTAVTADAGWCQQLRR
jgi:hypothetical protein